MATGSSIDALDRRREQAVSASANLRTAHDELYRFVLPYRRPSGTAATGGTGGRVDQIFDSTAPKAAFRFAGRMEQEVTPPFQQFFELKAGPFLQERDRDRKKAIDEQLEDVTKKVGAVFEGSNFAVSMNEMYLDLFGGTGALLMQKDADSVLDFTAVPIAEISLKEDGKSRVTGIYWDKMFPAGDLEGMWRDAKLPKEVTELATQQPEKMIRIVQATEFNRSTKKWDFTVYAPAYKAHGAIYTVSERTCQWLTPRFYKVPGEAMGRGPGLMALPAIKTLNKVTELTIKAAAFAILGLWTYRNDRKFNPKTARMSPGAMWAVGSNAGPMGPSVQKLDVPGRFDISNLVLNDLRAAVKEATLDDTLPPDQVAVKSATEIVERMKRLSRDLAGAYGRLVLEIIKPLVQRAIDALDERGLIEGNLPIDQLIYKVQIVSPVARSQQASQVSAIVEWLQLIAALGGQEMMMLTVRLETIFTEIGRKLGVSETLMRSDVEKKQIQSVVAQIIANAKNAAAQAAAGGAEAPMAPEMPTQQGQRADLLET